MSADNWANCKACIDNANREIEEVRREYQEQLDSSYGEIPLDEYQLLQAEAAQAIRDATSRSAVPLGTFREDYEFYGAEDGEVTACYSGRCTTCGYGVSFKHTVPIPELAEGKRS